MKGFEFENSPTNLHHARLVIEPLIEEVKRLTSLVESNQAFVVLRTEEADKLRIEVKEEIERADIQQMLRAKIEARLETEVEDLTRDRDGLFIENQRLRDALKVFAGLGDKFAQQALEGGE